MQKGLHLVNQTKIYDAGGYSRGDNGFTSKRIVRPAERVALFRGLFVDYQFQIHFSLDQANALIPYIRRLFAEVHLLLGAAPLSGEAQVPTLPHNGENRNGNGNGNGKTSASHAGDAYVGWSDEKRHEAAYRLLNALQTRGIVVQDVERGLIDFPYLKNEEEVFLCYELSDGTSIRFFHALEDGFAGRREIDGDKL